MKKVTPKGKKTAKVKKVTGSKTAPEMMFVQRWVEHKGIKVHYTIDFERGKISLIDPNDRQAKKWDFSGRSLEYMKGWLNIIDAMRFAVEVASKELKEYQDENKPKSIHQDHIMDVMMDSFYPMGIDWGIGVHRKNLKSNSKKK